MSRRPKRGADRDRSLAGQIVQQLTRRHQAGEMNTQWLLRHIEVIHAGSSTEDGDGMKGSYTVARLLYETTRLWRDRYEQDLREQHPNLTGARCTVLVYLAQHEGTNQSALAQFLDIRPSTLVRLLDRLEAAGFVTRRPDPRDRRAHLLVLTAKAWPVVASICGLVARSYDDHRTGISKAEIGQLQALLRRIQLNLADSGSVET